MVRILAAVLVLLSCGAAIADERADKWRADIVVAREQWLAKDRSYARSARVEAERRLGALADRVPELKDYEIVAELAHVAALSRNAHTRAYVLRNRGYWRRYPLRIWKFANGWHVVAAQREGVGHLGRKITAINGKAIAQAQAAVRPLFAGNDRWAEYMASYSLTSPEALLASGVINGDDAGQFTVESDGASFTYRIEPMEFAPRDMPEESWWFLSPTHPAVKGWTHVLANRAQPTALKGAAQNYRVGACAEDALYLQFNRAQDGGGEALAPFGERVIAQLKARVPRKMIVDLRFNTGGDATKAHRFFNALSAMAWTRERGRLAVILGPNTFSAGITHAVWLKQETAATFVGTQPGDELDTWSEGGNVDLPNSKLRLHYADMAHRYSKQPIDIPAEQVFVDWNVDNLTPDVPADWTWAAYVAGRDPYAEATLGRPLVCGD